MTAKQVIFQDAEGTVCGGILLDSGEVICLCCGSIFEPEDYDIIDRREDWVDLTQ